MIQKEIHLIRWPMNLQSVSSTVTKFAMIFDQRAEMCHLEELREGIQRSIRE